jgi:hypothetical protein
MVKHIVAWRLKEEAHGLQKPELALKIKEMLEELQGQIPGLLKIEVGIDFSCSEQSSDVVLYSEFTDRAALDAYQIHPLHQAGKSFIGGATLERRLVDFEA